MIFLFALGLIIGFVVGLNCEIKNESSNVTLYGPGLNFIGWNKIDKEVNLCLFGVVMGEGE